MSRAQNQRKARAELRRRIERAELETLGDAAREIAARRPEIDWVDLAYWLADEVEHAAREVLPHLPLLDPELMVEGGTMRDLHLMQIGDLRTIGGALGKQIRAVIEVRHDPGRSEWINALDLAECSVGDPEILAWLGSAKVGDRLRNMVRNA